MPPPIVHSDSWLKIVHAQNKGGAAEKAEKAEPSPPKSEPAEDPNVEYVTPGIGMGGPVATNLLLSNRIACDHRNDADYTVRRNLADSVISPVCDEQIAILYGEAVR